MKFIRKSIPILLAFAAILTDFSFASSEDHANVFYRLGQNYRTYINEGIGNEQAKLRHIREMNRILGIEVAESEVIDRLRTEKVELQEAERLGIYITDQEFNQKLNRLQSVLKQDNNYLNILAFCEGAKINEDEYWEYHAPNYKMQWTIGKLYSALYKQFLADNPDRDRMELHDLFDEYYKNYINELKQKYGND